MARERIVVGLACGTEGEILIRRAAGIINRSGGGELLAVHLRTSVAAAAESPQALEAQRRLAAQLGGSYHTVAEEDPVRARPDFARAASATRILVGTPRRRRFGRSLTGPGTGEAVVRDSGELDVQIVPHREGHARTVRPRRLDLGRRRVLFGFAAAVLIPVALQ
ncbi:hypothetical protein [Pseudarthrobacter sp. N5]|uniref:hypothetical protein n=1 Tax=Pseudarthrobacter sp. N5 TaxID=3418416 RepID=UPI003CF94292